MAETPDTSATPNVTPQPGDNSSAPKQTAPVVASSLPAAAPGADAANSAQPIPPSGAVAGTTPSAAGPTPVAGQDMSDQSKKPNMATKILSGLMGGKPNTSVQTDQGPISVKRDWQPGELARHVVASAASLLAAGIGGEQAAKNKRPFELAPGTSLGDIKDAQALKDKADAQAQFENKQNTDKLILDQHKDAREQQDSMIRKGEYDQAHQAWLTAHANDDLVPKAQRDKILSDMQDQNVKMTMDYQRFLEMPGSQVMKDAQGNELNFATGDEAKAYVHEHPEVLHGMTNGKSKFGVVVVANPATGATQLIDFPADRHETGLNLVGAKTDPKTGEYMTDKDGNYIPDGTVLGRDGKPTYLTETVSPQQVRDIRSKQITQDKILSQINDYDAQAKLRTAEINKYPALKQAMGLVDAGAYASMTDPQKKIAGTFMLKQETIAESQLAHAQSNLLRLTQLKASGDDVPDSDIAKAQSDVEEAKDNVSDSLDKYNNVTGNTAGVRFANKAIRDAKVFNQPWGQTDGQISAAPMSAQEQQIAKDRIWNSLTPAQRAIVNPTPETQAKAAVANQVGAPSAKPHATPQIPAAQGFTYLYDLEGLPHPYPNDHVDRFLASPDGKGWTK